MGVTRRGDGAGCEESCLALSCQISGSGWKCQRWGERSMCALYLSYDCVWVLFIIKLYFYDQPIPTSSMPIFEVCYIGAETREGGGTHCPMAFSPFRWMAAADGNRSSHVQVNGSSSRAAIPPSSSNHSSTTLPWQHDPPAMMRALRQHTPPPSQVLAPM